MDKIVIIGASGHAKVIIDAIELESKFEIFGFIDSYKNESDGIFKYNILITENFIPELVKQGINKGIIAIGENSVRKKIYDKIKKMSPSFSFITVIHPSAVISPYARIGKGSVILTAAKVNADAVVGKHCVINTNASLGHDAVMKDFSSLAPSAVIGGGTNIGLQSAICMSTTIVQNINVGDHTVIGASSLVLTDIPSKVLAYGTPASVKRSRKKNELYLG